VEEALKDAQDFVRRAVGKFDAFRDSSYGKVGKDDTDGSGNTPKYKGGRLRESLGLWNGMGRFWGGCCDQWPPYEGMWGRD
jgi:hypothetical protein